MKRRTFIAQGSILATGIHFRNLSPSPGENSDPASALYSAFKNPDAKYRPFVRWWWNGDKIERNELARELRLLKDAGIGGVEINPVKFPARTNDLGELSLQWLSPEWIELLKFTFEEAKSLGIVCDLIVGSGWPFGAEWLQEEERSQAVVIGTKKLEGPLDYKVSLSELFKEADPAISSPFAGRKMEMLSVKMTPSKINSTENIKDLSDQISSGMIQCKIPEGKHVLYALVKINGFMEVIQGAPGATGPVLNHYNKAAVKKYLTKMSDSIQQKTGPLSSHLRSLFSDSLELEGSNWCADMAVEFQKRRGYDLVPWLPFVLYKIAAMGNTWVYNHGAEYVLDFKDMIQRIRYDFELTKAELIKERFVDSFVAWCKENKVQSRMQAYGRGYFPLEGSFDVDIPECETWLRAGLGTEMSETDYRVGRAYTMINKYVSSAAHLKGKKLISCEELTNIHSVFNETLELMKIAADQSIISGVTHSVFHGFNYSPPEASLPGWVIYGTFINERNPWWPYFKIFTAYKTRLSALLQQATMFADIAILPATADLWSIYGAQNDPFPAVMHPVWQTLIWESINQNGNACDYISEQVIKDGVMQNGYLHYGQRKYHSIFLPQVESMEPGTAKKLFEFVLAGGRIFCIEAYPTKTCGWNEHQQKDKELLEWIAKLKNYPNQFIVLKKPDKDFTSWYKAIQEKYSIIPYISIDSPNPFVTQVRYQAKNAEILLFINSNMNESYELKIAPSWNIVSGKQPWIWDAESGERYEVIKDDGTIILDMGPAGLKLLVFDKEEKGILYKPIRKTSANSIELSNTWTVTGNHIDGTFIKREMDVLKDLKEFPGWDNFCGGIIYQANFEVMDKKKIEWLNLGKAFGVSELFINGQYAGTRWYGRRIYPVAKFIKNGNNNIEIKIMTTAGNYLKSLKENPIGQYWTNEGRTIQPIQPVGLAGPVTVY
ncbi:MAG: glycosyl hydrolase [Chitinophagaceae bacterium]